MAKEFSISVDLSQLVQMGPIVRAGIFDNLAEAVESVAQVGVERWQTAALKAPLWEGERRSYAESIRYRMVGRFAAEIISDYRYVEDIESGRPAYDLKRMLNTSPKVRRTKDGRRFLVIPFRHNTPGNTAHAAAMPKSVYGFARKLAPSKVAATGRRPAGEVTNLSPRTGMHASGAQTPFLSDPKTKSAFMVAKRDYDWGGRIKKRQLKDAGMNAAEQRRYAGMVRFKEATGGHSHLTFRIMMEGSSGWIIPPRPGLWIARAVAESLQRTADIDFPAAVARDISGP